MQKLRDEVVEGTENYAEISNLPFIRSMEIGRDNEIAPLWMKGSKGAKAGRLESVRGPFYLYRAGRCSARRPNKVDFMPFLVPPSVRRVVLKSRVHFVQDEVFPEKAFFLCRNLMQPLRPGDEPCIEAIDSRRGRDLPSAPPVIGTHDMYEMRCFQYPEIIHNSCAAYTA